MNMTKYVMLIALLVGPIGCASTRQYVPIPDQNISIENPDNVRIYVMRPTSFGGGIATTIKDGSEEIGATGPGGYLCWERKPGKTVITGIAENHSNVDLEADKGKAYYIFQHIRIGFFIVRNKMELLSDEEGKTILKKCKAPKKIDRR